MDDLISRSSVLKGIEELQKSPWYNYGKELDRNFPFPHLEYIARKEAVIVIHDLCIKKEPAVDAVPVIRCKDCRYYNTHYYCGDGFGWCERNGSGHSTSDDWFCADGQR